MELLQPTKKLIKIFVFWKAFPHRHIIALDHLCRDHNFTYLSFWPKNCDLQTYVAFSLHQNINFPPFCLNIQYSQTPYKTHYLQMKFFQHPISIKLTKSKKKRDKVRLWFRMFHILLKYFRYWGKTIKQLLWLDVTLARLDKDVDCGAIIFSQFCPKTST